MVACLSLGWFSIIVESGPLDAQLVVLILREPRLLPERLSETPFNHKPLRLSFSS
jgi:hypothetical protein